MDLCGGTGLSCKMASFELQHLEDIGLETLFFPDGSVQVIEAADVNGNSGVQLHNAHCKGRTTPGQLRYS